MKKFFLAKQTILQLILLSSSICLVAQPLDSEQSLSATFKKAVGLHQQGQYKEALILYRESLKDPGQGSGGAAALIDKQIRSCEYAIKRKSAPDPVIITKLGGDVNGTNYSNINVYPNNTEDVIYFTSPRPEKGGSTKGETQMDRVCIAQYRNNRWDVKVMTGDKRYHESVLGLSSDGKDVFVFRGSKDIFLFDAATSAQMSMSGKANYTPMEKRYKLDLMKDHPVSSLAITRDKKTIYLSMNDYGERGGHGGYDIWQTRYDVGTGVWSKLTNLGPTVNTENDEISVSILPDGATIFFSSNGHKGFGKFDIYRSEYVDALADWGKPVNLGYPINTANDDIYYSPVQGNPSHAYYSSERETEPGVYDILFVNYYGKILSDEEKDKLRKEYLKAVAEAQKGIKPKSKEAKLLAKKGYDAFPTDSVRVGMKTYLRNILFANAKATLKSKSYKQLEPLYRLMIYHPTLQIEVSGHTDDTGKKATNQRLSQERAQSVVDYLVGRGIEQNRLVAKGYGDTQPITPNKTTGGKKLNRRVEFKVISLGGESPSETPSVE
ncbi:MAG: OmpA family protein [Prevotellaceae bacterium]|nr:OmpA family protein [Prevotellaceae bacterium]